MVIARCNEPGSNERQLQRYRVRDCSTTPSRPARFLNDHPAALSDEQPERIAIESQLTIAFGVDKLWSLRGYAWKLRSDEVASREVVGCCKYEQRKVTGYYLSSKRRADHPRCNKRRSFCSLSISEYLLAEHTFNSDSI